MMHNNKKRNLTKMNFIKKLIKNMKLFEDNYVNYNFK